MIAIVFSLEVSRGAQASLTSVTWAWMGRERNANSPVLLGVGVDAKVASSQGTSSRVLASGGHGPSMANAHPEG